MTTSTERLRKARMAAESIVRRRLRAGLLKDEDIPAKKRLMRREFNRVFHAG